jgi:diacylglycerol kinase (ATP)
MSNHKKFVKYNLVSSFVNAYKGFVFGLTTEPSALIQLAIGVLLIMINAFLGKWIYVEFHLILMFLTLSQEIMNTAIEYLCDMITMEYSEKIKRIKDLAAGSVFVSAVAWGILICANIIHIAFNI